jgi:flagellar biosynthesis/type III secretory pathway ATPase
LINVGAYKAGSSPDIDRAIAMKPKIDKFLKQQMFERSTFAETLNGLKALFNN